MQKENLLTYFTKDITWVQPFATGSLLIYLSTAANLVNSKDLVTNTLLLIVICICTTIIQGFFALNTHTLVSCSKGEVKLAHFKNLKKLFVIGFKYFLAALLYGIGIGSVGVLVIPVAMTIGVGNIVTIMLIVLWAAVILYLLWMFLYMSFAYSRELTFHSMFKFSNFGKYRIGKYILCSIVFCILIFSVSIFFAIVMKDKTTYNYFINLICAPAAMWYSLILSKIQAESILEAITKEKPHAANHPESIPTINIPPKNN